MNHTRTSLPAPYDVRDEDQGTVCTPRGVRFSLAPDGNSILYSTQKFRSNLWMLTGYRQPGCRARIADAFGLK